MARPSFPKTLREFRERFAQEAECYEYLIQSRWPEGMVCPRCQGREFWHRSRRWLHQCRKCGFEVSPTAGTLLQDSHMPVREWFWTAYLVATHTPGLSAKQLQRQLGCSYKTAWYMLHRLRRAMVNQARNKLQGVVEADETFVGGAVEGFTGRGVIAADNKTLVLGAVEVLRWRDQDGVGRERAGRLRLTPAARADAQSIGEFLSENVEIGTIIKTDGWRGYSQNGPLGLSPRGGPWTGCPAHTPRLWKPKDMAAGHTSRGRSKLLAALPRRVCVSLQPTQHADGRLPNALGTDRSQTAAGLPQFDLTGVKGISIFDLFDYLGEVTEKVSMFRRYTTLSRRDIRRLAQRF